MSKATKYDGLVLNHTLFINTAGSGDSGARTASKYLKSQRIVTDTLSVTKTDGSGISVEEVDLGDSISIATRYSFVNKFPPLSNARANHFEGLYTFSDLGKALTWGELAYLVYYVGGFIDMKSLNWSCISPKGYIKVGAMHDASSSTKTLETKLNQYKGTVECFEDFITACREGKRYVPLPMYASYMDFCSKIIKLIGTEQLNSFNPDELNLTTWVSMSDLEVLADNCLLGSLDSEV